jgi:DHA2 family multidrug resistance protein
VVTILQLRQTYHTAMLSQTVTPENLPLQQLMAQVQQMAQASGLSIVQGQAMAVMMAAKQVAMAASVMAFDDVFRVTAVVTLLAVPPALFMRNPRTSGSRGPTIIAD